MTSNPLKALLALAFILIGPGSAATECADRYIITPHVKVYLCQNGSSYEETIYLLIKTTKAAPSLHRHIRYQYDRSGRSLARRINTPALSNLTYVLMKPLEWTFLLSLYLCCQDSEALITRQYPVEE